MFDVSVEVADLAADLDGYEDCAAGPVIYGGGWDLKEASDVAPVWMAWRFCFGGRFRG